MDVLKVFHQNVVTPRAREYLRIIVHCGLYEYLRMPFSIKNAPSHFQRVMNEIFPEEPSEGWVITYIDYIIVSSKTWKEFVEIHPTASSCKGMLYKARKHAVRCMEDSFAYAKEKWDKSHATPDFKVGDLVLVSTNNFNNIKGCKKLKDSFAGPFVIKALH
ncbi:hypothetical protein O181_079878 [Austropuccinia psidii MF-1]|uniref:Reverse transcriptase domain-containing protein n=1 Tax=Austropuccinia psidii MF-1 TaxID=1389203 RepID=A0A9Q3FLV3_9BASI|nr:hypothetical protein [Austropuccinia psidii MF-1]